MAIQDTNLRDADGATSAIEIIKALAQVLKNDPNPANGLGVQVPHGLQADGHPFAGLWSTPGPVRDMWATVARPQTIGQLLYSNATSLYTRAEYELLTGVQAARGDNGVAICDPAPRAGLLKSCIQKSYFGQMRLDTDTIEVPTTGGYLNAADMDRDIINLNMANNPFIPDILRRTVDPNTTQFMQMYTLGIQLERDMEQLIFQGAYATAKGASAWASAIQEFDGLDTLIATGKVDDRTNVACPAADSTILDWGSALIDGTMAGPEHVTYNIVQAFSELWYHLKQKADDLGMSPTMWFVTMHPDLFRALTRVWSCTYLTSGCNTASASSPNNIDSAAQKRMNDEMFNGSFLWVDGERVPVVLSRGMANTKVNGGFRGDIYFVPLSSMGIRTSYLEFFNQGNPSAMAVANMLGGPNDGSYTTTNNGAYAFTKSYKVFCHQYHLVSQPRLVMRTPMLAARMTNIVFRNLLYTDDPFPGTTYHKNGGTPQRYSTTLF